MAFTWKHTGFPSVVKNPPANAADKRSVSDLGRSPGEGNSNPLWYSCLENPIDREAWKIQSTGTQKSQTWLSGQTTVTWSMLPLPGQQWVASVGPPQHRHNRGDIRPGTALSRILPGSLGMSVMEMKNKVPARLSAGFSGRLEAEKANEGEGVGLLGETQKWWQKIEGTGVPGQRKTDEANQVPRNTVILSQFDARQLRSV